ncbi:OmpA family protein [Maricaulaceae bacterium NA33B04]|nr:OmpA family protein [Maricaulaceae bacterium NA33B04]
MIKKLLLALAGALLIASAEAQVTVPVHPLIEPYEGSRLASSEAVAFDEYKLIIGFDFDAREAVSTPVTGRLTRMYFSNPDARSELEIFTNYREALDAAGLEVIWTCAGDGECTTGSSRNAFTRHNGITAINGPNSRYVAGRLTYEERIAYIALAVGRRGTSIDIIETDEMERGLAAISLEGLLGGLDADGHVRVDGLLFAHDSDQLLAESAPALTVVAELLAARPDLALYVVGHTDMTGSLEYNLDLSRRRASSIVAALVDDYGISAERLAARGVGPLAPETTNTDEAGRAMNRRVEIVAR